MIPFFMVFDTLIFFPQLLYFDQEDNGGLSLALQVLYTFFCMFVNTMLVFFLEELIISDVMVKLNFNGSRVVIS